MNHSIARKNIAPLPPMRRRAPSLTETLAIVGFEAPTHQMSERELMALITAELSSLVTPKRKPPPLPARARAMAPSMDVDVEWTQPMELVPAPAPRPPVSPFQRRSQVPTVITYLPRATRGQTKTPLNVVLTLHYITLALTGVLIGVLLALGAKQALPMWKSR